ncbi:MAG: hypothetical protein R3E48_10640 [Burkholderiaceae bacterium]
MAGWTGCFRPQAVIWTSLKSPFRYGAFLRVSLLQTSRSRTHTLGQLRREQPQWEDSGAPPDNSATQWQGAGWVADRWAEMLPLELEQRVRLLTLDSPLVRLELIGD